jgi:hypothetical protein
VETLIRASQEEVMGGQGKMEAVINAIPFAQA